MAKAKYTKGSDNRWQTKVWDGSYSKDGSKHYATVYSTKSSADLEKRVNKIKSDVDNRNYITPCDDTFLGYARQWKKVYKAVRAKGTQDMYENIIEKHLVQLKMIKLQDIMNMHFQMVINNVISHPRTCQQISVTFKQIIRAAIKDKKLPAASFDDICADIELPKYKPSEKRALSTVEKNAIKVADLTPMERAFVLIIYGTGLRRGEALAQTKSTINLKRSEMVINEAVAFDGNNPYLKTTKNSKTRTVPLPSYLKQFLSEYLKTIPGTYLFSKRNGEMMTKSSYDKMWVSILRKLNHAVGGSDDLLVIFDLTAHVFRHNYCTNLCYQIPSISIKKIAYLLGDTEKMVIEVYNHIVDEKENPAQAVEMAVSL